MTILLTGATGYIGKRLLSALIRNGHHVICCVRDRARFSPPASLQPFITLYEADLSTAGALDGLPKDIDAAYYLVHSMSASTDYRQTEQQSAIHFRDALARTSVKHVMYLGGIANEETLSDHLGSRLTVEQELARGPYHFTAFRAGIIIGSGSASFEIIRDLVEVLPVMIAPKWLNTRCQPIAIADVISILTGSLMNENTFDQVFDIGGTDILTYRDMLLGYADSRQLKRHIWTVPVLSPRLSSYWLYFVTSTSFNLARNLVDSMSVEVVCRDTRINSILDMKPIGYREALKRAFTKIENNEIESSWKDSSISSNLKIRISDFIQVPTHGCFTDRRVASIQDRSVSLARIWSIGGETGWYYGDFLWEIRGFLDKLIGGVGLRRGRTNRDSISPGDTLDFWRVLYANREEGRLLLFAEMKLPGEAWLEFRLEANQLIQTATFRPLGLAGRLYWYSVLPFHHFIFQGMIDAISNPDIREVKKT
ncbi:MAG: SDR family oxidoreductase [Bacteroidetes bacterium]|nr:SDR family oxidoreductase [Bacteroidota bacterium]